MRNMSLYGRLLKLVIPYWSKLGLAMVCMVCYSALTASQAFLVKPAFDGVFLKKEGIPPFVKNIIIQLHLGDLFLKKDMEWLLLIPVAIVLLSLFKGIFFYGQAYLMTFVGMRVILDVRRKLYSHLQTLSLSFFTKTPTGIIMSRITNDVNLIQASVSNTITGLLKDVFTILGLIGVVFYQNWKLAIIALAIFPIAIIPIKKFGKRIRRFSRKGQQRMGSIMTFLHETVTGHRIVKAFNMEDYEKRRFVQETDRLFKIYIKGVKVKALSHPLMEVLGGVAVAVIIWVGGYSVVRGELTPGTFFSFMTALLMLYSPIRDLNKVNLEVQESLAAAARVFELLDTTPEVMEQEGAILLPPILKGIDFDKISFKYDEEHCP